MPIASDVTETLSGGSGISRVAFLKRVLIDRLKDNPVTEKSAGALLVSTAGAQDSMQVNAGAATRFQIGDWMDFVDDASFESILVDAIPDTTHLTVRRAHLGSTNAAHLSGAIFRLRGRIAPHTMSNLIDEAMQKLYPQVYDIRHVSWDASSTDRWYGLPADVEKITSVYQRYTSGSAVDLDQPRAFHGPRLVDSNFYTTKRALQVPVVRMNAPDAKLHATYIAKLSLTGLSDPQIDLISYEAAVAAMTGSFASDSKPERRSGLEGAPDSGNAARLYAAAAQDLRNREAKRLAEFLPSPDTPKYKGLRHYYDGAEYPVSGHTVREW